MIVPAISCTRAALSIPGGLERATALTCDAGVPLVSPAAPEAGAAGASELGCSEPFCCREARPAGAALVLGIKFVGYLERAGFDGGGRWGRGGSQSLLY